MVVIRLSRGGSKGAPFYNIVVSDSRNRRDSRFIGRLGFYNPVGRKAPRTPALLLTPDPLGRQGANVRHRGPVWSRFCVKVAAKAAPAAA